MDNLIPITNEDIPTYGDSSQVSDNYDGYILMIVLFGGAYLLHYVTRKVNLTKMFHDDMDTKSKFLFHTNKSLYSKDGIDNI